MKQNTWQLNATEELKDSVMQLASERISPEFASTLDLTTAATPADISNYLFMKIIDGELFTPQYRYELIKILNKELVRLGNKEYKYAEYQGTSDVLSIDSANTVDDFNGEYIQELAEVMKIEIDFHKKVKLPELVLSNAWVAAEMMVEFVQLQVEEMAYAIARRWENLAWTKMFAEATVIEVEGTEAIDYLKALQSQVEEYKTTSIGHKGIGTDGTVTISTVSGDVDITPDLYFEPTSFTTFVDKDQFVDTTFNNDAQWYNYAATNMNGLTMKPLAFSKYSGFRAIVDDEGTEIAPAVTVPAGLKFVLFDNAAIELLYQYDYTSTLNGRGPWSINHTHMKIDSYRNKVKPILVFVEKPAAAAPTKATKKVETAPVVEAIEEAVEIKE